MIVCSATLHNIEVKKLAVSCVHRGAYSVAVALCSMGVVGAPPVKTPDMHAS